jgi:O-antigen ligase
MTAYKSKSTTVSYIFFTLGLLWMTLAFGVVTLSVNSWKFAPAFFLFSISLIISLFSLDRVPVLKKGSAGTLLLLFAVSTLFSIFPGSVNGENYDFLYNSALKISYLLLALSSFLVINNDRMRRRMLYLSALLLIALLIIGFLETVEIIDLTQSGRYSTTGTFNNPNLFAGVLILFTPLLIPFLTFPEIRKRRIALIVLLICAVSVLFLTSCRSAYIGFVFSLFIGSWIYTRYFVEDRRIRKKIILITVILIILIISIALLLPSVRHKISRNITQGETRLFLFPAAFKMWLQSARSFFIGNGIGSFRRLLPQYGLAWQLNSSTIKSWHAVHNEYLELLLESGIVGFIPFILFLAALFKFYLEKVKDKSQGSYNRLFSLGMIMSAAAFLADSFFSTNFREPPISALFYIMMFSGLNERSGQKEIQIDGGKRVLFISLSIIILFFPISRLSMRLYTDRVLLLARESDQIEDRIPRLELAASFEPQNVHAEIILSREFLNQGNYSSFIKSADRVEVLIPSYLEIHYLRGFMFTARGDHKKAAAEYKKHLSGGNYDIKGERALLFSWLWLEDDEQVLESLKRIIRKDRENSNEDIYEVLFSDIAHIQIDLNEYPIITIGEDYILQKLKYITQKPGQSANQQFVDFHMLLLEIYKAGNIKEAEKRHRKEINTQLETIQSVP